MSAHDRNTRSKTSAEAAEAAEVIRSEEELDVDVVEREVGAVRVRKHVDRERVQEVVEREIEEAEVERVPAADDDTGEVRTLEDGSLSIPVFEERLVVEKRRVVAERVVVRKRRRTEPQRVEADVAKERVEVTADPEVADRLSEEGPGAGPS